MSTISLFFIAFGLMIILSRAPLIVAPHATRNAYLAFMSTDERMRLFGLFATALGVLVFWVGLSSTGLAAQILTYMGVLISAFSLGGIVMFPSASRDLAGKVWNAFSQPALRLVGVLSTIAGAALIYYGLSL